MNPSTARGAHAACRSRLALEAGAFLALALMVGSSAALSKRAGGVAPLAAVERPASTVAVKHAPATPGVRTIAHPEPPLPESVPSGDEPAHDPDVRWFNGRPVRPARVMWMTVTAYSPDARSCAPFDDGMTATLHSVQTNGMKLVAADTRLLPFGSMISVPGYDDGLIVPVLDRGAAIKGRRLDVLMPTHREALAWGVQRLAVVVWEYADGLPPDNPRKLR